VFKGKQLPTFQRSVTSPSSEPSSAGRHKLLHPKNKDGTLPQSVGLTV